MDPQWRARPLGRGDGVFPDRANGIRVGDQPQLGGRGAIVPDTAITSTPARPDTGSGPAGTLRATLLDGAAPAHRVRDMLSYLAATLPPDMSAEGRLLALQCALRSNTSGQVHLPAGLLRGMRLARESCDQDRYSTGVQVGTRSGCELRVQPGRPDVTLANLPLTGLQRTPAGLPGTRNVGYAAGSSAGAGRGRRAVAQCIRAVEHELKRAA